MSVMGQKRTKTPTRIMSALPPITDVKSEKTDIATFNVIYRWRPIRTVIAGNAAIMPDSASLCLGYPRYHKEVTA